MRQNRDLDSLELMRHRLQEQTKAVTKRLADNKYMSPKTANALLVGAAAITVVALPAAAMLGIGAFTAAAAGFGAATAVAALNKAKAVNMEINREGFSGFIAKANVYLKEHSELYKAVKEQHDLVEASPEVGLDFFNFKQEHEAAQRLAVEQAQREKLAMQSNPKQNQDNELKSDFGMSMR